MSRFLWFSVYNDHCYVLRINTAWLNDGKICMEIEEVCYHS